MPVGGSRWSERSDRVHSIKYWSVLSGNLSNVLFIQKLLIKSIKPNWAEIPGWNLSYISGEITLTLSADGGKLPLIKPLIQFLLDIAHIVFTHS